MWERSPYQPAHMHPAYVAIDAERTGDTAVAAVLHLDDGEIIYPFIKRSLNKEPWLESARHERFDLFSPYGYGGAYYWGTGKRDNAAAQFWNEMREWALSSGVVCEFIRFSLFEEDLLPYPFNISDRQPNVVIDLAPSIDQLERNMKRSARKLLRQAREAGVSVSIEAPIGNLSDFIRIYRSTMKRVGAEKTYDFGDSYFDNLCRHLADHLALATAHVGGASVAAELVLLSDRRAYSFLGGATARGRVVRANNLIKVALMKWLKQHKFEHFVLGGGRQPRDGIYRFKESFAPNGIRPFRTGSRIYSKADFEHLVRRRQAHEESLDRIWEPDPDFFPAYRS